MTCCDRRDNNRAPETSSPECRRRQAGGYAKEVDKGARWMPRLPEAMKDAASCENPRGGASSPRSAGLRMGQPVIRKG